MGARDALPVWVMYTVNMLFQVFLRGKHGCTALGFTHESKIFGSHCVLMLSFDVTGQVAPASESLPTHIAQMHDRMFLLSMLTKLEKPSESLTTIRLVTSIAMDV